MNENIEKVLAALDGFRMSDEMTYSAYSVLHDEISLLDDLLKAQEPRLLTEADFVNADHYGYMPAWAEEKNGDQFWKIVRVASLGLEKKRLRYWTSRPTDEQRKAVKWND